MLSDCRAVAVEGGQQRVNVGVDGDRFGAVVGLVDAHESVGQFKHVVTQRYNHELRVPCPLLSTTSIHNIYADVIRRIRGVPG